MSQPLSRTIGTASCAVCKRRRAIHRHHLVKQQRIRRRWRSLRYRNFGTAPYKLTTALNDPRLWIPVCGFDGCHVEDTPVPIPDGFWAAVWDYQLAPDLPDWLVPKWEALRRGQGALVDDREADMQAARDGYNPNR